MTVAKTVLAEGRGSATPSLPAEVNIRFGSAEPDVRAVVVSGAGHLIPAAVEQAICTMREGEKARIEWTEADGAATHVEVEPHSWMDMLDLDGDGSVLVKSVCTPEPAGNKPRALDMVRIRYCGRRIVDGGGGVFVNEGFGPAWEDGPDAAVLPRKCQLSKVEPEGLRFTLQHMWQGCSFIVVLQPQRGFGASDASVSGSLIPGASTIEFKVELCEAMVQGQACLVRVSPEYAYGDEGFHGNEGRVARGEAVEHRVTLLDFKAAGVSGGGFKAMAFDEQVAFAKTVKEVLFSRSREGGQEPRWDGWAVGRSGPCE